MRYECFNCETELEKDEVTEELYGDMSWTYCNRCGRKVTRIEPEYQPPPPPPRPKRFCFFIKPKDEYPESYTRFEEFFLALRIGYYKEAWRLLRGKPRRYIFEGIENNPMPF